MPPSRMPPRRRSPGVRSRRKGKGRRLGWRSQCAPFRPLLHHPPARSVPARRGEADQVQSRTWHQGCQPLHELQRAHAQVRGAIAPRCLELWLHLAGGVELHPLVGSSGRVMQRHRCSRALRSSAPQRTAACRLEPLTSAHRSCLKSGSRGMPCRSRSRLQARALREARARPQGRSHVPARRPAPSATSGRPAGLRRSGRYTRRPAAA